MLQAAEDDDEKAGQSSDSEEEDADHTRETPNSDIASSSSAETLLFFNSSEDALPYERPRTRLDPVPDDDADEVRQQQAEGGASHPERLPRRMAEGARCSACRQRGNFWFRSLDVTCLSC